MVCVLSQKLERIIPRHFQDRLLSTLHEVEVHLSPVILRGLTAYAARPKPATHAKADLSLNNVSQLQYVLFPHVFTIQIGEQHTVHIIFRSKTYLQRLELLVFLRRPVSMVDAGI